MAKLLLDKLPLELKNNTNEDIYDYSEIEVIEVPVVKRMVFQFKKPVKLKFS